MRASGDEMNPQRNGSKWGSRVTTNPLALPSSSSSALDSDFSALPYAANREHDPDDQLLLLSRRSLHSSSSGHLDENDDDQDDVRKTLLFGRAPHDAESSSHNEGKENLAPRMMVIRKQQKVLSTAASGATPQTKTTIRSEVFLPQHAPYTPSSVLGKRQIGSIVKNFSSHKKVHRGQESQDDEDADPAKQLMLHFEGDFNDNSRKTPLSMGGATLLVSDANGKAHLGFGSVPLGEYKTLQLTLENPGDVGNARVKYEGYTMVHTDPERRYGVQHPLQRSRFKCDLHVCVVDAEKSVVLRITFQPLDQDLDQDVTAKLKFRVNDKFMLECKVTGKGAPRAPKVSRFGRFRQSMGGHSREFLPSRNVGTNIVASSSTTLVESTMLNSPEGTRRSFQSRSKRRESFVHEMTPPRRSSVKRFKSDHAGDTSTIKKHMMTSRNTALSASASKPFTGSWWKQRKDFYDEHWMTKQEEGFTKWMNYVLVDATNQRLFDEAGAEPELIQQQQQQLSLSHSKKKRHTKRRFDFSSLRVLGQKRMESKWTRAALEIYHSSIMDDILFDLQEEISRKKLQLRVDRPVYADVGLQEELVRLLNNYHPVWLCLGLEAVLGHKVMKEEKCSLRSVFATTRQNNGITKMPRVLRRIILHHLVKDPTVARKFRLVKNLKTPMDGSLNGNDGGNTFMNKKKNITGREYFDALMENFTLKFLMLVLFLDRAIEHKTDMFVHFPCLFRVSIPGAKSAEPTAAGIEEQVKNSQQIVTEFCRLFLSSEGRIDKHLKQLGYTLQHQQTPLDEIDLEIKHLAVDLRDGVRLAKLMEALTSSPSPPGDVALVEKKSLSNFLRVPALSRLQKVHNVEICLHFLQEKCGHDVLSNIKNAGIPDVSSHRVSGRLSASSSSFVQVQNKADERLVEKLAKDIVDGHREKTLALLWKLISCFQLQSLVDIETLKREIENLKGRMSFRALEFFDFQQRKAPLKSSGDSQVYSLLLEWCRAVCANYLVRVVDFTGSFADGKVLCYLLHYYHPMLLSKSDILPTTNDVEGTHKDVDALMANERHHFTLVNDRVKQLGEIPVLIPQYYHTNNPPEEKMVLTFVCYLQSRLMDSSKEIHAASRLKRWWMSPYIRLLMRRKKDRNAKIIQRFWYTSSQKRLAIRQCRKLLRAVRQIKSMVVTWIVRKRFLKMRSAAVTLQNAFRRRRLSQNIVDVRKFYLAVSVIQRNWRQYIQRRQKRERKAREEMKERIARRLRMKDSCLLIEKCWMQFTERRKACQLRLEHLQRQHISAKQIQACWHQHCARKVAYRLRTVMWKTQHRAAATIQRSWIQYQYSRMLFRRILENMCAEKIKFVFRRNMERKKLERKLALERFHRMLEEKEKERRRHVLKKKIQRRSASCIQTAFRAFAQHKKDKVNAAVRIQSVFRSLSKQKRYRRQRDCIVVIQRNFRVWQSRRRFQALIQELRDMEKRRQALRIKVENRAAFIMQLAFRSFASHKRIVAATRLQSVYRCYAQKQRYRYKRACIQCLQYNIRVWRQRKQYEALKTFYGMLLKYQHMQELEQQRANRLQALLHYVENRAAWRIQLAFRSFSMNKKVTAAVRIQSTFRCFVQRRGYVHFRCYVINIQKNWRMHLQRTTWCKIRNAAITVQARFRGLQSRRKRFNFYALQAQLYRLRDLFACWRIELWYAYRMTRYLKKRALERRARWTKLCAGILRKRTEDASKIANCWRSYQLRCVIQSRIADRQLHLQQLQLAVAKVQNWWVGLRNKWQGRLIILTERQRRYELEVATTVRKLQVKRASRVIGKCAMQKLVYPQRRRRKFTHGVVKVQSWWRGMLVRLHQCSPDVTTQRKILETMTLVESNKLVKNVEETAKSAQHQQQQPLTLGARLEMALHLLLHGKRLQDMLFASHTIEICTKYSRECCWKCVELKISNTIFAAIRGLNRSRPHVELLHQLLLVLVNLTTYEQKHSTTKKKSMDAVMDDLRAVEALVDLLHIHRDMHHVFALSARVLKHYLAAVNPYLVQLENYTGAMEIWRDSTRRLHGLHELLVKKTAVWALTASTRTASQIPGKNPSGTTNLMSKINPKTAATICGQLLKLLE